jgi:hypothetical protein
VEQAAATYVDDVLVVTQLDVVANLVVADFSEEGHVVQTLLLHHVHPFCLLLTGGLERWYVQIDKGTSPS